VSVQALVHTLKVRQAIERHVSIDHHFIYLGPRPPKQARRDRFIPNSGHQLVVCLPPRLTAVVINQSIS
jgi:hypothetical protein